MRPSQQRWMGWNETLGRTLALASGRQGVKNLGSSASYRREAARAAEARKIKGKLQASEAEMPNAPVRNKRPRQDPCRPELRAGFGREQGEWVWTGLPVASG